MIWTGATSGKNKSGYGVLRQRLARTKAKSFVAHRFSYEHHKGPIPPGMVVRHLCHVPLCVNPDHLEVGTHAENMRDMAKAKRSTRREKNPSAKLTMKKVKEMRKRRAAGESFGSLAARYGVSRSTAWDVCSEATWREDG